MARIEAEATRMGVLVDDLLMLARLDQGRELRREPVDLVPLARDLVNDARVWPPTGRSTSRPTGRWWWRATTRPCARSWAT